MCNHQTFLFWRPFRKRRRTGAGRRRGAMEIAWLHKNSNTRVRTYIIRIVRVRTRGGPVRQRQQTTSFVPGVMRLLRLTLCTYLHKAILATRLSWKIWKKKRKDDKKNQSRCHNVITIIRVFIVCVHCAPNEVWRVFTKIWVDRFCTVVYNNIILLFDVIAIFDTHFSNFFFFHSFFLFRLHE